MLSSKVITLDFCLAFIKPQLGKEKNPSELENHLQTKFFIMIEYESHKESKLEILLLYLKLRHRL